MALIIPINDHIPRVIAMGAVATGRLRRRGSLGGGADGQLELRVRRPRSFAAWTAKFSKLALVP
ncbi:MAG: hypothetical protein KC442_09475, partial [Thermomicrobiales bacterium]|nr:hypothetical protein [Thermomicrobiales bacterium]